MQIWKPYDKKWRHNDIITKNNGKMWTSAKPNKLYITRKVLMRAIQKCTFYWIWTTMSKVMGIYVKFWHFYDAHSLNMAMSRDPRSKFRKNLFLPNSAFNIRKSYKICSRKALYFRSYQPKTSRGGGGWKTPPPPVLLGLKEPSKFSSFWPKNVRFDRKQFGKLYKKWKLHLHLKRPS